MPAANINRIRGLVNFPPFPFWRFAEGAKVFLQIEIFPATRFGEFSSEGA
jgi:hypothetical protein